MFKTLAVGVNLRKLVHHLNLCSNYSYVVEAAHTVVIKGVKLYQNNAWLEYSDLDIIQMIGRAVRFRVPLTDAVYDFLTLQGRPQFGTKRGSSTYGLILLKIFPDKEGTAIIMCEQELEQKYRNLVHGTTLLESSLHQNLAEHINSEIGIGTIRDVYTAKTWLRSSFLRQRVQKNPSYYNIGKAEGQSWENTLDDLVMDSIVKLKDAELINAKGELSSGELSATEYGDIMSKVRKLYALNK